MCLVIIDLKFRNGNRDWTETQIRKSRLLADLETKASQLNWVERLATEDTDHSAALYFCGDFFDNQLHFLGLFHGLGTNSQSFAHF